MRAFTALLLFTAAPVLGGERSGAGRWANSSLGQDQRDCYLRACLSATRDYTCSNGYRYECDESQLNAEQAAVLQGHRQVIRQQQRQDDLARLAEVRAAAAAAATERERARQEANRSRCLAGEACDETLLGRSDRAKAAAARRAANYARCYYAYPDPSCNFQLLTPSEATTVRGTADNRNLANCLAANGRSDGTCKMTLLTPDRQAWVREVNYKGCLDKPLGAHCNLALLTQGQLGRVRTAAEIAALAASAYSPIYLPAPPDFSAPCAENGSCYGDISDLTGRPKTVNVKGYYRKDGTYVRGHYRSPPRPRQRRQ